MTEPAPHSRAQPALPRSRVTAQHCAQGTNTRTDTREHATRVSQPEKPTVRLALHAAWHINRSRTVRASDLRRRF
eukprot:340465-Rhodomonas_salina.7